MTTTKTIPMNPESLDICVLYDSSNGRIAHIHRVATFAGAKKTGKPEIEARCLKIAKQLGHATEHLKTLHVPHKEFKAATPYQVDVKTLKLVERPRPARESLFSAKKK